VLDRLLMIVICSFLLWGHVTDTPFKIKWFVFAQTAAYSITAAISFFLVMVHTGKIHFKFEPQFSLAILKKSYPYAILILLMGLYNRIDSVMLERLLPDGSRQAGIYAQAFRILDAASMFALLFANLLLPMFSRMLKHKEPIGPLVQLSFFLILVPSIIVSITSVFFRHQVMELLYHSHVEDSATIFSILMIGFTAIATTYIFGTLLTANGSLKMLNIMAFFGMLINIGLNLILIPRYQALGAAVSSLITQSFTALAQVIIAFFIFGFNFRVKRLLLMLLFIAATIFIGIISGDLPYNWMVNMGIMIIFSTITAFSIGLIKIRNIYKIIRYDK
jgi:O-antigen/teichoic acid export membrane protein